MAEIYRLLDIRNKTEVLKSYIFKLNEYRNINLNVRMCELSTYARSIVPELDTYIQEKFNVNRYTKSDKNKGIVGQLTEEILYAQKPNSKSTSDLQCGYDVKSTHFKNGRANDRLTLTNCACSSYNFSEDIINNELFENGIY